MSATVALFRETLKHAAANYAPHYPEDCDALTALCKAAAEYAEARLASARDSFESANLTTGEFNEP